MPGEQLRVTEGKDRGQAVEVDGELHIGRAATQAEGRLGDDPMLSRQHAKISRAANGQLTIEDLGSANGTFVNDERIDSARTLALGDLVRVGHTVLQVTDASGGVPEKTRLEGAPLRGRPRRPRPARSCWWPRAWPRASGSRWRTSSWSDAPWARTAGSATTPSSPAAMRAWRATAGA